MSKVRIPRRRVVAASVLIACAAAALSSCSSSSSSSSSAGSGNTSPSNGTSSEPTIGFSQNEVSEQFQATQTKYVNLNAQQQGLKVMAINANSDPQAQYNAMVQMVNAGVKGIIVIAVDAKAIIPAITYANKHGVPVVTEDAGANGGNIYMAVRANNYAMAQTACQHVGKAIGGSGEVLMLSGDLGNAAGLDRAQGFLDCMKQNYPGITVDAEAANWDSAKASALAQTVLTAHPNIKAIYMATDTLYLTPTWAVLQRLHMAHPVGQPGHIYMVSIDGSPTGLAGIRSGELDLVISQPLTKYAEYGIRYIKAAIDGQKQSVGTGISGPIILHDGQLTAFIPPDLVTKANVSDPSLWGNNAAKVGG